MIFMKSWLAILLWALCLPAQITPSSQAPPKQQSPSQGATPQDENARKAKVLLDRMVQALGGQAYLNIQDVSQEGRTYGFYHGQPTGAGAPFWRFWKYPDKDRLELTKQRDWWIIHNGDKGFEVTFRGVSLEESKALQDYLRRRDHSLEWVVRRWLNEPGIALFYEGQAIAAEKQAEQVTILNAKNDAVTLFIDYNTHLPLKKSFTWRDPTDKQRNEEGEIYDNYKVVQGIPTPLSVTRTFNGDMANQRFITSVSYNQNLPDSLFDAETARVQKGKR
jgi:hypothetical protein